MPYRLHGAFISRAEAESIDCPGCGATPGSGCLGVLRQRGRWAGQRKPRMSPHLERFEAWAQARGTTLATTD